MTQQQIVDQFLEFLRGALKTVDRLYYSLNYWKGTHDYLKYRDFRLFAMMHDYLDRYHERVFCYELYFRLRSLMEAALSEEGKNLYLEKRIFLQSEVRKDRIDPMLAQMFQAVQLSKAFMPDFLLHTPGSFKNQLVILEVKSNPELSLEDFTYDLEKIQEFINSYHYLQGIFLWVNANDYDRKALLESSVPWIKKHISTPERIRLLILNDPEDVLYETTLDPFMT